MKNKNGATLIEVILVISVLAIISAITSGVIVFFSQLFIYSPRQLDTQKIAQELSGIISEGNQDIRGIRFARSIIDASATQFSYAYGYPMPSDGQAVRLRWDASGKKIFRSTSNNSGLTWSTETVIPYYLSNNTSLIIDGKDASGIIFTYKKGGDAGWVSGVDPFNAIRRVIISINLKTGSGSFTNFQGSTNFTSSVETKGF